MKKNIRPVAGAFAVALMLTAVAGCDSPRAPVAAPEAPRESVTRAIAIDRAQRDAAFRYAEVRIARVDARKLNGFWVVDLTAQNGAWLRYTISAADGSIRERNLNQ